MSAQRVVVVIVNSNAGHHLGRTLAALERQTRPPDRIIVVDNASADGSADGIELRHRRVEVVRLRENVGFAAANNLAVERADDCDWVALLNPDAFATPDWLERLLAAAADNPAYAFFGSRLLSAEDHGRLDGTGDVYHVSGMAWRRDHGAGEADAGRGNEEIFSPCAAAALYRRTAFVEVGGFDERFFCYYEDTDLSFRLRLAGHRCLYVDDACVHHVGSVTTGRTSDFTLYHSYRNQVWTWAKNMPLGLLLVYLPQHLLVNMLTVLGFALRGQARPLLRAKRDALLGLPAILHERRRIQRSRRVSARDVHRTMARGFAGFAVTFLGRSRLLGAPVHAPRAARP